MVPQKSGVDVEKLLTLRSAILESTFELFLYFVGSTMRLSPTRNQKVPSKQIVILTQKLFSSHPKLILVNSKVVLKSSKTFIIWVFTVNPVEALQEFWQMKVAFILIIIIIIIIIITRPKPAYGRQGLDWIVGPGYSFVVFSTNKTMETNQKP